MKNEKTRKDFLRKWIQLIREDIMLYERFKKKGDCGSMEFTYSQLMHRVKFAYEMGLIDFDYYVYLWDLVKVKNKTGSECL